MSINNRKKTLTTNEEKLDALRDFGLNNILKNSKNSKVGVTEHRFAAKLPPKI